MAFGDLVQSNTGQGSTATTAPTLGSATTAGSLIVLGFASDDYNGSPNAGWTQSAEMEQQTFHGGYLWWLIATAGMTIPSYTIGSATHSTWVCAEFAGPFDASPYDTSQGQFLQASATTYTTDNQTPTAGDRLMVAVMGGSHGSLALNGAFSSWLNSFTQVATIGKTPAPATCVGMARRVVPANGSTAYSSGVTYPTTVQSRSGLIIAFKAGAAGGGRPPLYRRMRRFQRKW